MSSFILSIPLPYTFKKQKHKEIKSIFFKTMNELTVLFPKKIKNTVLIPKGPKVDQEAVSLLFRAGVFLKLTFVFGFH